MGVITNAIILRDNREKAFNLINTVQAARTQYSDTIAARNLLRTKIRDDIVAGTWIANDFSTMAQHIRVLADIVAKRPLYRAELITLQALVDDTEFEAEIQAEIDLL